jgi:hypothetical protein
LKKDGSNTSNQNEVGVVWQEVCVEPNDGCVVRIKMDGFPKSRRPAPHSTKAILLNSGLNYRSGAKANDEGVFVHL